MQVSFADPRVGEMEVAAKMQINRRRTSPHAEESDIALTGLTREDEIEFLRQRLTARRALLWHRGEELTRKVLEDEGWCILERNWRVGRYAEIDIIALDPSGLLVFVEVKTRLTTKEFGFPMQGFESIGRGKQQKIVTSAMIYLHQNRLVELGCRVDVVIVNYETKTGMDAQDIASIDPLNFIDFDNPVVTHIRQAFA